MVEISEIKGRTPMNLAVGISNFDAAYAMTKHLAEKGYKRIGFATRPFTGTTASVSGGSGTGRPSPTWVSTQAHLEVEVPITSSGRRSRTARPLAERDPELDVIFCSSDTLAIGAIQECMRREWAIPGRIGVVGFGDMDLLADLPRNHHGPGGPLRDGKGQRSNTFSTRRPTMASPVRVVNVGFQIVDRDSA